MSRSRGAGGFNLKEIVFLLAGVSIVGVALASLGMLPGVSNPFAQTNQAESLVPVPSGQANSVCNQDSAVTITPAGKDALQPGTSVQGTYYLSRKSTPGGAGTPFSTTMTAAQGEYVDLFILNSTAYHSAIVRDVFVTPCQTSKIVEVPMYANSTLSITVWNTLGTATLGDGGLTTNATATTGETLTLKVRLQAQNLESTNPLRCVLESNSTTKMKEMSVVGLPGATKMSVSAPSGYTVQETSSVYWVYDLDAVTGSAPIEGFLILEPKTSQTLAGTKFIVTCYNKENFLDSQTGAVVEGVEDSTATAKYILKADFDGRILAG